MSMNVRSCLAAALFCALAVPVQATLVDWEDGAWLHGVTNFVGYQGGQSSGSTNGGTVSVQWANFGSSSGNHSGLGGAQPRVNNVFNGSADDGALSLGTGADNNTAGLVNYSTLTIVFSSPINLQTLLLGDVDRGGASWQDFVAIQGRIGGAAGALRTTSYTTSPARNGTVTHFGLDGVRGTNGDENGATDGANITASFNDSVDFIRIFFFQGPDVTQSNQHGIWLRDLEYLDASDVPEPGTFALAGLGILMVAASRLRIRKTASARSGTDAPCLPRR